MTPYYDDGTITIYHGDCREIDAWLTADVLVSERENAMRQGMNDFLSKPIDPERLVRVLAHWVRRARMARG